MKGPAVPSTQRPRTQGVHVSAPRTLREILTIAAPPHTERSFAATLPPRERRLAGRLEGFGDIVFGFAVSQCALQLPTVKGHADIAQPASLLLYFATFGLLASLWLIYHRMMSGAYRPTPVDLVLAFTYLALVSLMPYAQYSISHDISTLESARRAVAEYATIFGLMAALAAAVTLRNLRRGWEFIDDDERGAVWLNFLLRCVMAITMFGACTIDLTVGPLAANLSFLAMVFVNQLLRIRIKKPPSRSWLRIAEAPEPVA